MVLKKLILFCLRNVNDHLNVCRNPKKMTLEKYSLAYAVSGNSELKLLLFHGFGQNRTAFDLYHEKLNGFEIYSFDLIFHVESTGPEKN